MMEAFGEFGLAFILHVYVPEPGLAGRVKHRLCGQIQRRFAEAGIVLPLPSREIHLHAPPTQPTTTPSPTRIDSPSPVPAPPFRDELAATEPVNRCVDE